MNTRRAKLLSSRLFLCAASLVALVSAAGSASAEAPAHRLAKVLGRPSEPHPLAFRNGRIPVTLSLPSGVSAADLGLVPVAPHIGATAFTKEELEAFSAAHPTLIPHVAPPLKPLLDRSKEWTRVDLFRTEMFVDGKGVAVGVVDTGIDIEHPDFRDENGKTRIAWMLTAEAPRKIHEDIERQFGCLEEKTPCAVYSADDINQYLETGMGSILGDQQGHGTHVASIAAGNGGPMLKGALQYVGVAPAATLIIANTYLPGEGFTEADVLNGTRFIFEMADAMGMPAVANLSIGTDFGPHDGTSDLEKGLSALVGDNKPGRAIVLASGNSGAIYQPSGGETWYGIHTEARVSPNSTARVPIYAPKANKSSAFVWITFSPGDEVSVGLEGPGGETLISFTSPNDDRGYSGEKISAGVINNTQNGKAPIPPDSNSAVVSWEGSWGDNSEFAILMEGKGNAQLWITGLGDVDDGSSPGLLFRKGMKQGTITAPASAPSLLAVGCTMNRLDWTPYEGPAIQITGIGNLTNVEEDSPCFFSSAGPTPLGVAKPEIVAPGGFVAAAMSNEADPRATPDSIFDAGGCPDPSIKCFVVDNYHALSAGTSMSSPHVAGAAALLLAVNPMLTQAQITDILQASARYPSGTVRFEVQTGPGELDMEAALQTILSVETFTEPPDVRRSWYVLSSEYARPDPKFPVWGTVELRRANGSVASGIAGSDLELAVEGGLIVSPLTKVRHGLFRFAVAGDKGSAGTEMKIDVLYNGQSIQKRILPIGLDFFNADGAADAIGGYSCSVDSAQLGGHRFQALASSIAAAMIGLFALRRRRS